MSTTTSLLNIAEAPEVVATFADADADADRPAATQLRCYLLGLSVDRRYVTFGGGELGDGTSYVAVADVARIDFA